MGFFKKRSSGKPYDLFSSLSFFIPDFKETFMIFLMFLLGTLLGIGVTAVFMSIYRNGDAGIYGTLISYPVMFLPALLYASAKSRRNIMFEKGYLVDSDNFGAKAGIMLSVILSMATVALSAILSSITELLPPMPENMEQAMEMLMEGPLWATLLSVSVMAPFFEELLCRGLILRGLLQRTSPAIAITVSSVFFALLHANIWQGIPALGMGLMFGYVYYKTGSLKLTMLMHCVNNTFSVILGNIDAFKDIDSFREIMSPGAFAATMALCAIITAAALAVLYRIPIKEGRSNCKAADAGETEGLRN